MSDTMVLAFNDTEVRSITEENEIWFALVDVCKILELSNPRRVAQRLDDDEKRNFKLRLPGRDPWFVNEPGLYHVIFYWTPTPARRSTGRSSTKSSPS